MLIPWPRILPARWYPTHCGPCSACARGGIEGLRAAMGTPIPRGLPARGGRTGGSVPVGHHGAGEIAEDPAGALDHLGGLRGEVRNG